MNRSVQYLSEGFLRIQPNARRLQSPTHQSAMAGAQCCENPPVLSPAFGEGSVAESLGGLKAYTVGSPNSKAAVVLVSDIFGMSSPPASSLSFMIKLVYKICHACRVWSKISLRRCLGEGQLVVSASSIY